MPISDLEINKIRAAILDFQSILINPSETNETACKVYRNFIGKTFPQKAMTTEFILAGKAMLFSFFGSHERTDCPEITDAVIDLKYKAALLELRDELRDPYAPLSLSKDKGKRLKFCHFLEEVLDHISTSEKPSNQNEDREKRHNDKPSNNRMADILATIRAAGFPIQREEIIKKMRLKNGGGSLGRNLSWMVKSKILKNHPNLGYWFADEDIPK